MAGNSFGTLFKITTFGESHGAGIGVVIDGCPPGMTLNMEFIRHQLNRRKPGQSAFTTQRKEGDEPQILSGVLDGKTTGAPLTLYIINKDQRSADYQSLQNVYRPSHADYTYEAKYGFRDHRGSGRASARETAARVMAGAVAMQFLQNKGITCSAYVQQIGEVAIPPTNFPVDVAKTDSNEVRCPDAPTAEKMKSLIIATQQKGDTLGGIISGIITGVKAGLGEPVFDKLHARLGYAMLGINAVKGFELGSGFNGTLQSGSSQNDAFTTDASGQIKTQTNNSGGVQGGISNGMDITFNVAFKPVSTLMMEQSTVDQEGNATTIQPGGRHDVCVLPRAVPIVEAMAALVIMDFYLLQSAISVNSAKP
jgi:chorismate synthase